VPVHLKVDTGMGRFGVRWDELPAALAEWHRFPALVLEGVASHFAMSDEVDKSFALLQLDRFREALGRVAVAGFTPQFQHFCNSGGILDLPAAHFNLVRPGLLALGVFPSAVCRRIGGIAPVMSVKARLVSVRRLEAGDPCGYGLRYRAPSPRRVGLVPVGYGDGFPRLRNTGEVLVRGRRAPLIGSVAMDAFAVDLTDIPAAQLWDEVVIQGRQGEEAITAQDLARWKGSVSYDILVGWRARLPRVETG
jgi:alanine racemase